MAKILGLDLGTNSIGWAYIDEENQKILGMGSRIFPEGVENLGEGSNEISKNATRTLNRSIRRQHFRKRLRKQYLLKILAQHDMCPISHSQVKAWNINELMKNQAFSEWVRLNPYELRARAVEDKISLLELGRIFYHMVQRRGFQSNSRSAGEEEGKIYEGNAKEGKIGIHQTKEKLKDSTLGKYLNDIAPKENQPFIYGQERIRNRYTTRQMYVHEFEQIWNSQVKHHQALTDELKAIIGGRKKDGYEEDGALFYQRPLRSQKHLIGHCSFEPKKTKCPVSAIPFELFRIYQWVNTVECNGLKLEADEREKLVEELLKKEKPTFKQLKRAIGKSDSYYQFNYKDDDRIVGSHTISKLSSKKFFGSKWAEFTDKEREDVWHVLFSFEDKDKLTEYAQIKWGFDLEKAKDIADLHLKDGYSNLSRKAIHNILPFLKMGYTYNVAVVFGGIKHALGEQWNKLSEEDKNLIFDNVPEIISRKSRGGFIEALKDFLHSEFYLNEKQLSRLYHHSSNIDNEALLEKLPVGKEADREIQHIRNPVVIAALFEVRKLVNELIDIYGRPNTIKIELARDLKHSKNRRNETRREQQRLERENDRVKKELDYYGKHHSHENILKFKLWEECNKTCPFTGKPIEVTQLFSGEVQIEHIHPWSRSLNDSFMNKTLCFADENRLKGNRTPYEYYSAQGEEKWELIKAQALSCFKSKSHYPKAYNKFKHFIKKEHDDQFVSRQLNDTRYISKEAKNYLGKVCNEIVAASGQATAHLRHMWGLNSILNDENLKNREDHRHHAVDALVLACTRTRYLQELSNWNKHEDRLSPISNFPHPWETFRKEAEGAVDSILVSHKRPKNLITIRNYKSKKNGSVYENKGVAARGQLHKETVYGKRKSMTGEESYRVRKPIETRTTKKHIEKIVDPVIRRLILERIETLGGFKGGKLVPEKTFFEIDENGNRIPQIFLPNKNGDPVPVLKVRVEETVNGAVQLKDINQYTNPSKNHHLIMYKTERGELKQTVVSFWTAVERKLQGQDVVQVPEDGELILDTFQINDMFLLGLEELPDLANQKNMPHILNHLYKVQKVAGGGYFFEICFRKHTDSRLDKDAKPNYLYIKNFGDGTTGWLTHKPVKVRITPAGRIELIENRYTE